jgi:hypothetical protein
MKKYLLLGLAVGTSISLVLYFLQRKKAEGMEFEDFVGSSGVVDDLFGNAFQQQSPDRM